MSEKQASNRASVLNSMVRHPALSYVAVGVGNGVFQVRQFFNDQQVGIV